MLSLQCPPAKQCILNGFQIAELFPCFGEEIAWGKLLALYAPNIKTKCQVGKCNHWRLWEVTGITWEEIAVGGVGRVLGLDSGWVPGRLRSMVVWNLGSGVRWNCFKSQTRTSAPMVTCLLGRGFCVAFWEMLGFAQAEVVDRAPR